MGLCDFACPLGLTQARSRTHSQGVDQSTWPLQKEEGRTEEGEAAEIGPESLVIIVTVSHTLATQCHHQSALALGVWRVTLCLFFNPPVFPYFSFSSHAQASFLSHSQPPTLFVYAKRIFVILSPSLLSITAIPASPVIQYRSWLEAARCPLFRSIPVPTQSLGQGRVCSCKEEQRQKNFDISQQPQPHEWLMCECWLITLGKEPIFWPET